MIARVSLLLTLPLLGIHAPLASMTSEGSWRSIPSMLEPRVEHTVTLLQDGRILVTGGCTGNGLDIQIDLASCLLFDPARGTWSEAASMAVPRTRHTATVLPNGKVLVAGGNLLEPIPTAEIYDPRTNTWAPSAATLGGREGGRGQTATLLRNGKVLIVGEGQGLYDPETDTCSPHGLRAADWHTATLLSDGKVLVCGGNISNRRSYLYDPGTGVWTETGLMTGEGRKDFCSVLLPNGKVLAFGGESETSELFDPATGTWTLSGSMSTVQRRGPAGALLPDGRVLAMGGHTTYEGLPTATCEIYDLATGVWTLTASMADGRWIMPGAPVLPDGSVIVCGGGTEIYGAPLGGVEVFRVESGGWTSGPTLSAPRAHHTSTLLANGTVLVSGGGTGVNSSTIAELFDPLTGSWTLPSPMLEPRAIHTATLLSDGRVLITGGTTGTLTLASCEIYDPLSGSWSPTGPMSQARQTHGAVLLKNGKVLVVGGYQNDDLVSCELYDPSTGSWNATGSMGSPRRTLNVALLPDGRVLAFAGQPNTTDCEVYDPLTGTWSPTGSLSQARNSAGAAVLPDGRVLVVGGDPTGGTPLASAEVYNPATGSWSSTGSLSQARWYLSGISALPSGRVLVCGGGVSGGSWLTSTEIYDPLTGIWTTAPPLSIERGWSTLTRLADGRLLAVGGLRNGDVHLASVEVFTEQSVSSNWKPLITSVNGVALNPTVVTAESTVVVEGARFRGISPGGGGTSQTSNDNLPIVRLTQVHRSGGSNPSTQVTGRSWNLNATGWSDGTRLDAELPPASETPNGYYLLSVIVNGIAGEARILSIVTDPATVPPILSPILTVMEPTTVNNSILVSAFFEDNGGAHEATWDWGDGTTSEGVFARLDSDVPRDHVFACSVPISLMPEPAPAGNLVQGTHAYSSPGVYTITLTVTDADGNMGTSQFKYAVVYDPEGGFVTGGGSILSPSGAYSTSPELTGRASFGFVSKYKPGASLPTGNTQFRFHNASFSFSSTSYEWLVVAGSTARFKGRGTVNGGGDYSFMVWAKDVQKGETKDTFRIKIVDRSSGGVIYDNQRGDSEDAEASTSLEEGNIRISKP